MTSPVPNGPIPSARNQSPLEHQQAPSVGRAEFQLFGPLGSDAYLRYHPVSPNDPTYAVKQIEQRYATDPGNQKIIDARMILWGNYERLTSEFSSSSDLPAVETVFHLLKEISPLAKSQLDEKRSGLGLHLQEVASFCKAFFQAESGMSRFPTLITDRHAALMSEVIAPLHDALKYLGTPDSQIMPDHEILTAELVRNKFENRLVTLNGRTERVTEADVDFIAGVIGDHENIHKELGRSNWINSSNPIEQAKALFFVADTLTGALREEPVGSNRWCFDPIQLDQRFIDLYFRHIDPVKGKVFQPEWALHAVKDLANTLDAAIASGCIISGETPEQSPRETLIDSAIEGINRALKADADRWSDARAAATIKPEKYLTADQIFRVHRTLAELREMKSEFLHAKLEKP